MESSEVAKGQDLHQRSSIKEHDPYKDMQKNTKGSKHGKGVT